MLEVGLGAVDVAVVIMEVEKATSLDGIVSSCDGIEAGIGNGRRWQAWMEVGIVG